MARTSQQVGGKSWKFRHSRGAQPAAASQLRQPLVGPHLERLEDVWAERVDQRHVGGVPPAGDDDAADAQLIVARIERVPAVLQVHLDPGAEVHGRRILRHADIAQIAVDVARRDVEAAAQGDHQVREVAAHALLLHVGFQRRARGARVRVAEGQVVVDEVADRLHARPARLDAAEQIPGDLA